MSAGEQTPKIIVSYRRTDSAMAGRIFDRLVQRFGKKSLFIDIDNIPFGSDFRKHIDDALKSSDLLIALIGPKWVGEAGKARIIQEADPVRVEIETALKRDIPILPVLLDDARMPDPSELPESIRDLAYRNAADVESGRDFDVHVDRVIKAVEQILGAKVAPLAAPHAPSASDVSTLVSPAPGAPPSTRRFPMPLVLGGALLALAGLAAAIWFTRDRLTVAEGVDPTTGTAYCADYKQVIGEARTNFASIIGRSNGDGVWISTTQLPGWDNCIIHDWKGEGQIIRYFGCELPSVATLDELHAQRDGAVAYLQSCLGKQWAKKRSTFQNGATDTKFTLGSDEPVPHIRESIYTDSRGNILRIDVDVPSSLVRPVPTQPAPEQPEPSNQAETYCEDLKRVVAAAPDNFATILGPVSGEDAWATRVQLPDWAACQIREWITGGKKRRYFTCQRGPFPTLEALRAKREEGDTYVKPCLGPDWSLRRAEYTYKTIRSIYFMGPDDPEVVLREAYAEKSKQWWLQLDVDAALSLATPAPETTPEQPVTPPASEPTADQPTAPIAAYCENLKRIVGEARTNFASILGPTTTQSWPSRIQLPGWSECRIMDFANAGGTKRALYCYLTSRFSAFEDLRAKRDEVVAEVDPCLGTDWGKRLFEYKEDKTTDTIYSMGTEDPVVRVRESYYEDSKDWALQIQVEAPPSAAKQPDPPQANPDQPLTPPPGATPNQPPPPPPPPPAID